MSDTAPTGSIIASVLQRAGSSPIFTLNGGHIWGLYLGARDRGIPLVDVRHEQTAGFAAEGWARLTRTLGTAAVTAGPGVTNTISAIAQARQNDSPVLVLGGRAPAARWGMGSLQELDHIPIVSTLVKSANTVEDADQAYRLAVEAVGTALSDRTGPAFLDVPLDLFLATGELPDEDGVLAGDRGAPPDSHDVDRAAAALREAQRPAIVAGNGVWWSGAEHELRRLAEAASAPVVMNGMARGMLPPGHPLFGSRARSVALGRADLILVVGAPLDFRLNFGRPPLFPENAQVITIGSGDVSRSRGLMLAGDIRAALAGLADSVAGGSGRRDWVEEVAVAGRSAAEADAVLAASSSTPVHPARLVAEVGAFADPDAIIVGDGGDVVSFAGRLLHRDAPGLWLDPGPYGCLGAGPGYALAAKLAHPNRQVILISGDGAFGFSAMEFDTLVRHRLPVVCVVGNNGIWGLEKHPMQTMLGTSIATDLAPDTRYDLVVQGLGGYGEMVERPEEIRPALRRAVESGLPACVNVLCDPGAEYPRSAVLG